MRRLLILATLITLTGCISLPWQKPDPQPDPDPVISLPQNPQTGQSLPGSISEQWTFKRKDYDKTFRIAFPSHFANVIGIDNGSHCTVNGVRAEFRGFDTDHGANRPKYTLPQSTPLTPPLTCILYPRTGDPVGWFKCDGFHGKDYLPDMSDPVDPIDPEESGNEPETNGEIPASWSSKSARNWDAGRAEQGQYHGTVTFSTQEQATNFRYRLRSHFEWDLNVLTGYPTSGFPRTGCVNILVDNNVVTWRVNP